jgi:hypothetical protein
MDVGERLVEFYSLYEELPPAFLARIEDRRPSPSSSSSALLGIIPSTSGGQANIGVGHEHIFARMLDYDCARGCADE